MENKALRDWADGGRSGRGSGKISALAKHLGLSQPAVSKMIDGSVSIRFEYIKPIIEFTNIKAKDLLPDYYVLFCDDISRIEHEALMTIEKIKTDAITAIKKIEF